MALALPQTLEEAIKAGDLTSVTRLIREGADPSQADEAGRTPLIAAVQYGNSSAALQLLEDPNLPLNSADQLGRTPMHYAAAMGQADIMKVLLAEGANASLTDRNQCTPLLYAAAAGHSKCVQMLVSHKEVDVNRVDKNGYSALMLASSVGDVNSVKALLGVGAVLDLADKSGTTALMMACRNSHAEVARCLVEANAMVDAENHQGQLASDMTQDLGIQRILDQQMAKSNLYRERFSIMASSLPANTSYGLLEEAEDVIKGVMVELRFYSSKEQRDALVERLSLLNAEFVANIPVTNRTVESEIQNYVFTDRQRHPEAPHCMVVIAGELYLEEVLTQASMMSFMEMIHIFRSLLECVEHLHLCNVVHCNLSSMSFMRFYDGIYRIVDIQDSRLGSEFYGTPSMDDGGLDTVPPELAGYFLHNDYQQPAKSSRDMWSLGGILLAMITGSTITEVMKDRFSPDPANDNRGALGRDMGMGYADPTLVLETLSALRQSAIEDLCQNILEKSMRTYTIRFPDSSREGVTKEAQKEYLAAMVRKSPAVARLVDMMNMLKSLLSVNPRSRPTCTEALNFNIFTLGMGAPAIKSQELLKLQMTSAQAEAQQLALMEEIAGSLKTALKDQRPGASKTRRGSASIRS